MVVGEKKKGRGAKRERLEERLEGSIGYGLWSRYGFCLGLGGEREGRGSVPGVGLTLKLSFHTAITSVVLRTMTRLLSKSIALFRNFSSRFFLWQWI